jgi:TatD DNase family protein
MAGEAGQGGVAPAGRRPVFTDTHSHLSLIASNPGQSALDEMLLAYSEAHSPVRASSGERAGSAPLIVDPGVEAEDFPGRLARFGHLPFAVLAAGIWPSRFALENQETALALLAVHAAHPLCRAIGECGPDYHHMNGSREAQIRLFEAQMELAEKNGKPLIVHSRDAAEDTIRCLETARLGIPVVLHCFGYGPQEAERFLSIGCTISFAGNVSYASALPLREACRIVPPGKLFIETDAPYMNPLPRRGKPSTSLDIERTYRLIAELRGQSLGELSELVQANARKLFGV